MRAVEVAVDYFDQLLGRTPFIVRMLVFGIDQMRAYMVFQHDGQQAIHRAAAIRDELQHVIAAALVHAMPQTLLSRNEDFCNPADFVVPR